MDTELLASLGFPPRFTGFLLLQHQEQQLHRYSLPEFIAIWKRFECEMAREDGDLYALFGDFVHLRAVTAEIGGTIGSTSDVEPEELMQLITDAKDPIEHWESGAKQARLVVEAYSEAYSQPPESLFHLLTVMVQNSADPMLPEIAEAEDIEQRLTTKISLDERWKAFVYGAFHGFDIGLAIAILYPDFYYSMGEFNPPTAPGANRNKQSQWPIKRELYLAQCHIWAQLCRPDLAYLIAKT